MIWLNDHSPNNKIKSFFKLVGVTGPKIDECYNRYRIRYQFGIVNHESIASFELLVSIRYFYSTGISRYFVGNIGTVSVPNRYQIEHFSIGTKIGDFLVPISSQLTPESTMLVSCDWPIMKSWFSRESWTVIGLRTNRHIWLITKVFVRVWLSKVKWVFQSFFF